jgi:hypothetical protein
MQTRTAEGTSTSILAPGIRRDWSWSIALLDTPILHPDNASFHRVWKARHIASGLPSFSDFTFEDLAPWLGSVSIARAQNGDMELELIGCSMTNQAGEEISRVNLADCKFGPVGENAREMLETVTGMGVIALPCRSTEWRNQSIGWHGLALPLADNAALICLFVLQ